MCIRDSTYCGHCAACPYLPPFYIIVMDLKKHCNLCKFAMSIARQRAEKLSASGGLCPPDQGLCPWTPLGAPPPDPCHRLALPHSPCTDPLAVGSVLGSLNLKLGPEQDTGGKITVHVCLLYYMVELKECDDKEACTGELWRHYPLPATAPCPKSV